MVSTMAPPPGGIQIVQQIIGANGEIQVKIKLPTFHPDLNFIFLSTRGGNNLLPYDRFRAFFH